MRKWNHISLLWDLRAFNMLICTVIFHKVNPVQGKFSKPQWLQALLIWNLSRTSVLGNIPGKGFRLNMLNISFPLIPVSANLMVTKAPHDTIHPPTFPFCLGYSYSILLEVLAHNLKWNMHFNLKMWKTKQITLTHKGGFNSRISGTFIQDRYCGQWRFPQESSHYSRKPTPT